MHQPHLPLRLPPGDALVAELSDHDAELGALVTALVRADRSGVHRQLSTGLP
jgi:hypothetical protein